MSSIPSKQFFRVAELATSRYLLVPLLGLALVATSSLWYRAHAPTFAPSPGAASDGRDTSAYLDRAQVAERLSMLAGCFTVRYQFVEDGRGDYFLDDVIEAMRVEPAGPGFVAHNSLVHQGSVILHWTQEWQPLDDGRWSLTVKSGDGALRYQSTGAWRMNQWESEPARAVKPTRDMMRDDYDHLERRNIIQFTRKRWIQSEVNVKRRADGTPVASEVGWITYTALPDDTACATAAQLDDAR